MKLLKLCNTSNNSYFCVVVVRSPSCVWLFVTPWTAAHQPPLSFTIYRSLLKLMSTETVMPSNHLILCLPLFLLPSIFPSIRVFSNEWALRIRWSKYWSFSFTSVLPMNNQGLSPLVLTALISCVLVIMVMYTRCGGLAWHAKQCGLHD